MSTAIEENTQEEYDREYEKAFYGDETPEEPTNDVIAPEEAPAEEVTEPVAQEEEAPAQEAIPPAEGDDPQEEPNEETEEEPAPEPKLHTLKWNGDEIQVTDAELIALGQKGFDYTSKMQNVSKYRKDMEASGIDDNVMNLMKKVKGGDKTAFAQLAKLNNIDPFDLIDVEVPENYSDTLQNESQGYVISEKVAPLIEQVKANPELQAKMSRAENLLPNAVIAKMGTDADLLYNAVSEIDSGAFDIVMPRVQVRLAGLSDLDREYAQNSPEVFGNIYIEEKSRLMSQQQKQTAQPTEEQQPKGNKPNMAEVGVKKSNSNSRHEKVIKDAFNDDGEYQKILDRVRQSR